MSTKDRLLTTSMIVAAGMLLGRVLGLVRELTLAAQFGLTRDADLAMLAISLPDLLNTIFIGGAVSAVMIPEFHRLHTTAGLGAANRLARQFLLLVAMASIFGAGVIAVGANFVVSILAPGLEGATFESGTFVVRAVAIALPCCAVTAVISALLQAQERVVSPAFGTVLFNAVVIASLLLIPTSNSWAWVSLAVVAAVALRLAGQGLECVLCGVGRPTHSTCGVGRPAHSAVGWFDQLPPHFGRRYVQAFGAVGLTVFIPVVARAFASHMAGGMACFNYAYKLVELPFGLFGAVLTMAVFPKISRLVHEQSDRRSLTPLLALALSGIILATVPAVVFFVGGAEPVARILFQRGNLGPEQVREIAELARLAFLALPALVLTTFVTSVFHALQDTRTPFVVSAAVGAFLLAVCYSFGSELVSLMVCVVTVQWLNAGILAGALRVRHGIGLVTGPARWRVLAGVPATAVLAWLSGLARTTSDPWIGPLVLAFSAGTLALAAWCLLLWPLLRSRSDRTAATPPSSSPPVDSASSRRMAA